MEKSSHNYQVVFSGAIQRGNNIDEVKRAIATVLRLTVEKTDALFSGRRLVLKRTATLDQAEAFVRVFASAGAVASVEQADGTPVQTGASAAAGPAAAVGPLPPVAASLRPYRPFPANWLFKPALFVAATLESLLTLLYVVLLVGAGLLLFYHTLLSGWLFEAVPQMAVAALLSAVMLLGGTALILLLAKPLLGLFRRKEPVFELMPEVEPEFFNYVAEIAALVGTTPPAKILVDNGALLTVRPVWSWRGVMRHERQLTVGLALLAGLNSRQFAALLAQALYPWRPGFVPALGRLLNGNIRWLHRAGYGSDIVDRKLREWQQRFKGAAPLLQKLASFASWSAKPAIWRLAFSRMLSRRLIHRLIADGDSSARHIAGNSDLRIGMEQSRLLGFAAQNTLPELQKMWHEKGELPDNIATAVVARAAHYPAQIQTQLNALQERRILEQGAFRPSDVQRLVYVNSVEEKGQYEISAPCAVFFRRLEKLMHIMTIRYYHSHLHIPVTTNKLVRVAVKGSLEYEADQRIVRYFGDAYADFIPLRLAAQLKTMPSSAHELAQRWRAATAKIAEEKVRATNLALTLHNADDELIDISNRELLQRAGLGGALTGLALRGGRRSEELQQQCRDSEELYEKSIGELDKALAGYAQRLAAALALLNSTEVRQRMFDADKLSQEISQLLAAHEKIESNYPKLRELRMNVILLESLLSYEAMKSSPRLRDRIRELCDDISRVLAAFAVFYKSVPFPLRTEEHYLNLLDWVQAQSSAGEGAAADYDRGNDVVRRMGMMQRLIMGRLVTIALHVESVLGLKTANT
jgi:hypothetical protein